jgi:replicative DNA helicase
MNNDRSEEALIGSLILDASQIDRVGDRLASTDFADKQLGKLFAVMQDLRDAGKPAGDLAVLLPVARSVFGDSTAGRLGELATVVPNAAHAAFYADQVKEDSQRRQLALIAEQVRDDCQRDTKPSEIIKAIDAALPSVGVGSTSAATLAHAAAVGLVEELKKPVKRRPVRCGIDSVDRIAGGLMPGELEVIAARPGNGKTSLAMQIAMKTAEFDRPVLFVSLEMKASELIGRVLCGSAGVSSRDLRQGAIDAGRLDGAVAELEDLPLTIFAPPTASMRQIRATAKMQKAQSGLELLIVDYIGLVKPRDRRLPRTEQVAEITGAMKRLAKELELPVIALCQLNRQADGATPSLSHLRESGAIEQDADVIVFLHRERKDEFELIIGKHRHGSTGRFPVTFDGASTRFSDR